MRCSSCDEVAAVRDVEFGMEIGLIVIRLHRTKKGRMCPDCIRGTFWTYTLTTLFLGWWGLVSFFVTPIILFMNILSYRAVFLSPPYPADEFPTVLSRATVNNLQPYRNEIFQRLFKGEALGQISEDIAERAGVSAAEVQAFYNSG